MRLWLRILPGPVSFFLSLSNIWKLISTYNHQHCVIYQRIIKHNFLTFKSSIYFSEITCSCICCCICSCICSFCCCICCCVSTCWCCCPSNVYSTIFKNNSKTAIIQVFFSNLSPFFEIDTNCSTKICNARNCIANKFQWSVTTCH